VQPVVFPESTRQSVGITGDRGLLVVTVAPDSSAEQAGILLGDIIVTINGSPVQSSRSLQPVLDSENVGKPVAVEIVRGGKLIKLSATVGERPRN
jgi:S1-C subfamily serine protease